MNETYVEYMVARKPNPLANAIKVVVYALAVVFCLLGIIGRWWFLIPAVGFFLVGFFLVPQMNLEFEYLYLDKEITIDKIISQEKRKRVMVLDLNKMEFMAPVNSHEFDSYKNRNIAWTDCSSKEPDAKPFGIMYHDPQGDKIVIIEPNTEMLKAIKTVFPRKVIEY